MTEVNTVVTTVTPKTSNRGKKPTILPGGKALKEARAEAAQAVRDAKTELRIVKEGLAAALKAAKAHDRLLPALDKAQAKANAALAATPKDTSAKAAAKLAKEDIKQHAARTKALAKDVTTAQKVVDKATAAWEKAKAASLKVEEARLTKLN